MEIRLLLPELKVSKTNLYDFRVQWRQSYYYRNQDDDVVLPITTAASGLSKGLTDYHDWATVRKLGTASFTFHATNQCASTSIASELRQTARC